VLVDNKINMRKEYDSSSIFTRFDINVEIKKQEIRQVSANELLQKVANCVAEGDEELIEIVVKQALNSINAIDVINKGLIPGMDEVTRLWEEGVYFLPQVILSSDTMMAGISLCEKLMGKPMVKKGKIVTHTAEGDIHDIGQTIVNALLNAAGFEVINLGADVPVDEVVATCLMHRPILVTGTALMTTTMTAFPRIAAKLKDQKLNIPFVCGGGAVSEEYVTSFDLGIWGKEVSQATSIAEDALKGRNWKEIRKKWNG
jgi:methanol corrinoid protein